MNPYNLKNQLQNKKTITSFFWSAADRFLAQGFQLFFNIILARILMPEDFGLIGILTIFLVFAQIFIDSGMGSGLVQKQNRTDLDYSTVFLFNIALSFILYVILFFSSPLIALFFGRDELTLLTRVLGLNLVINSFSIVQRSILTINLDFKNFAKVNSVSILISGIIAVIFASFGFGVWALVFQNLSMSLLTVILFFYYSSWKFSFKFSSRSFNDLFSYGSKLLLASIYSTSLNEVYNISISKIYNAKIFGYYTNAKKFSDATSETITSVIQQVTFPILSSLQSDKERLIEVFIKLIRFTSFIIMPFMTLFAILADPFIRLVLTDKWEESIPILQYLCFARMITPLSAVNLNILKAIGRSDLFLKVDLVKFPIIILVLFITIPHGIIAMVIGNLIVALLSFFINSYMPGKLFGYGALAQIKDMLPITMSTTLMALFTYLVTGLFDDPFSKLIFGIIVGISSFLLLCYFFKLREFKEATLFFKTLSSNYKFR